MRIRFAVSLSVPKLFAESVEKFEGLVEHLKSREVFPMCHSELERDLKVQGRYLLRALLQEHPGSP